MKNKKYEKLALLGLGKDNLALLEILDKNKAPVEVTICDFRVKEKLTKIKTKNLKVNYQLGINSNQNLDKFSLLFRSPGWPLACSGIKEVQKKQKNIQVTSALNFFFHTCPSKNIIGVTGTKGKGTTATLIYKILCQAYQNKRKIFLGGNIGISPLSFLEKIKAKDWVVLELSSFQLEDLKYSPKIAVITNLFKEHLAPADPNNPNYHASMQKYWQAKLNIAQQSNNKYLIANESLKNKLKKEKLPGKILYFSSSNLKSKLVGSYNKENIAAAIKVSQLLKIKKNEYESVVANFKNLKHRLELIHTEKGIRYYDNSFATTPESTAFDLKSFSNKIIQIAGGADKGADFNNLAKTIKAKASLLILVPGAGSEKIKTALKKIKYPTNKIRSVKNMKEAVIIAKKNAKPGNIVLLSTGCASFGLFKNYKERGDLFKKYVKETSNK